MSPGWSAMIVISGEYGLPQVSDSGSSVDPRMRGAYWTAEAYSSRGQGTGILEGACAAPPRAGHYAPVDFDNLDSESWSPSRSACSSRRVRLGDRGIW
jgi:hypothetical protein